MTFYYPIIILAFYQILSFVSLFVFNDVSSITYRLTSFGLSFIIASALYFNGGIFAYFCLRNLQKKSHLLLCRVSAQSSTYFRRLFRASAISAILYIVLLFLLQASRTYISSGLSSLILLPLSILATKVLFVCSVITRSPYILLFFAVYTIFLVFFSGSKIGVVYLLSVFILSGRTKYLLLFIPLGIVCIGLLILKTQIEFIFDDPFFVISSAFQSFLNRFDSLRTAYIIDEKSQSLISFSFFDAIHTLLPFCKAADGCLNISASFTDIVFRVPPSQATYELNISTEANLFFGLLSPLYLILSGYVSMILVNMVRLKTSTNTYPVSNIAFFLVPSSIWSAGLLSTRFLPYFLLELVLLRLLLVIPTIRISKHASIS